MKILINIDVPSIEKATEFYREAFDLKVGRKFGTQFVELLSDHADIFLLEKPEGSIAIEHLQERRNFARHWTPVHLDFVVESLELAVKRVRNAGAMQEGEIETAAYGRIAYFSDPFGNGFCLIEFMGRGYDELLSGQVSGQVNRQVNYQKNGEI